MKTVENYKLQGPPEDYTELVCQVSEQAEQAE
jgi:hypothetical protein